MGTLGNIRVKVAHGASSPDSLQRVLAVAHQLQAMLETLVETGQSDCVDLRRLPLTPTDCASLRMLLGRGEVRAEMDCLGPTRIQETAVPGLWWVSHCNQDGQVLAELIEVTALPELLQPHPDELRAGPQRLRARMMRPGPAAAAPKSSLV